MKTDKYKMDADKYKTDVFYRKEKNGDIIAFFPETGTCYVHMGQHGDYSPDYVLECTVPLIDECVSLIRELEELGYNLRIVEGPRPDEDL